MSSIFPEITSRPIRVGGEFKSPYQWAAVLAPSGELVAYKDALLWIEGEEFGSREELLAKVQRIIEFQRKERGGPPPSPIQLSVTETGATETTLPKPVGTQRGPLKDDWQMVSKPKRLPKAAEPRLSRHQLAEVIVQEALAEFGRVFTYTGPSLRISDVYSRFDPNEFTYPQLIGAVRDKLAALPSPYTKFGSVPKSAIYSAAGSPGKGKNFNIKVQRKDSLKPGGWSAVAQIHVLWE